MLARLENEQAARHDREKRLDELEMYVAETSRIDAAADRDLRNRTSNRALLVTILLVAVGLVLEFTGHEAGGNIVLGTTLVGVVGAFLANQIRASR